MLFHGFTTDDQEENNLKTNIEVRVKWRQLRLGDTRIGYDFMI